MSHFEISALAKKKKKKRKEMKSLEFSSVDVKENILYPDFYIWEK